MHYVDANSVITALRKGSPQSVGHGGGGRNTPQYWYEWNGKVGVYPTFTRTTETITVYYIERPTAIASTTNVSTPHIYDTALTLYIAAQAWLKDLKPAKYLQVMALYDAELQRVRGDLTEYPKQIIE